MKVDHLYLKQGRRHPLLSLAKHKKVLLDIGTENVHKNLSNDSRETPHILLLSLHTNGHTYISSFRVNSQCRKKSNENSRVSYRYIYIRNKDDNIHK